MLYGAYLINLFHIPDYKINTADFNHLLHGDIVFEFEEKLCNYVGAKYGCSVSSATNAIFLSLLGKNITVEIPSVIPAVVGNVAITSGNKVSFRDDAKWVGGSYTLHDFGDYKIIDSAQKVERDQFSKEANDDDLMIFSFYPTKPIGSCDGGMVVSNNFEKIKWFKEAAFNGMTFSKDNWDRTLKFPGYKMHMNSLQAFLANENLKKLDDKNKALKKVCDAYNSHLGLVNNSRHLYRINVKNRTSFIKSMKNAGIQTGIHYDTLHNKGLHADGQFYLPESDHDSRTTVSLPFNEKLTPNEVERILKGVDEYAHRC
tara:strand:- start:301 stop:1245 length:945 start_codon:yes stop_codon:yes gene_type:complete